MAVLADMMATEESRQLLEHDGVTGVERVLAWFKQDMQPESLRSHETLSTESADDSSGRLSVRPQRCQGTARKRPGMAHGDGLDDGQTVGGTDRIGGLENSNGRRSGAGSALAGGEG